MLAGSSLESEGFVEQDDLLKAAKLEMRYALSQGIIGKDPTLEDTYLTLKCWFLFSASPEFAGCTDNPKELWGDLIDIAIQGHAAVSVIDVLKDPESQVRAWEWAKRILRDFVDGEVPIAKHFFLKPMFRRADQSAGDATNTGDALFLRGDWDEGGSDSDEGACVDSDQRGGDRDEGESDGGEGKGKGPVQSGLTVCSGESVAAKVACVIAKLRAIVTSGGDEPHKQVGLMLDAIRECLRSWERHGTVEYEPVPTDGFEYDVGAVWETFELFAFRPKMNEYAKKVERYLQAPDAPDEGDDSWRQEHCDDDEPDLPTVSVFVLLICIVFPSPVFF